MVRTTITSVKSVIQTSLSDSNISPYIDQSNRIVTSVLSGQGLTDSLLKDIETWLTAHLIAISKERQPEEERVGKIWLIFQENPDGFLRSTTYGQMVLFLDTSGALQKSAKLKASIRAIKQINC